MNAWDIDEDVVLRFKSEEEPEEVQKKDFEKGEYQWADEPETTFFKVRNEQESNAKPQTEQVDSGSDVQIRPKYHETTSNDAPSELTIRQMRKILKKRHREELEKTRKALSSENPSQKIKNKPLAEISEMSDKYLKKQISLNRNVLLYEKKWLFDREFKFFFSSVYYQNILATDLRWREDYRHLLFVRLMSYHNIGRCLLS